MLFGKMIINGLLLGNLCERTEIRVKCLLLHVVNMSEREIELSEVKLVILSLEWRRV